MTNIGLAVHNICTVSSLPFFHRIKKASTISEQMLNEQLKDQQHHITDLSSELKHHQNICTELSNELGVLQTGMEQVI